MSSSPENIFNFTHSKPIGETDELNEISYSLINSTLFELLFFTNCKYSELAHRTLLFGSGANPFKTLSLLCEFTWSNVKFIAQVSCPYPDFLNANTFNHSVRLYTKHPLTAKTIYTYVSDIWNFKPYEYVFRFLAHDFGWFSLNLDTIKNNISEGELLNDEQSIVLDMMTPEAFEIESKGKEISSILLKPIMRVH